MEVVEAVEEGVVGLEADEHTWRGSEDVREEEE